MGYYNGRLIWHETWSQYFSGRTKPSISRHFLWMCFSSIHWVLGESNSPWRCLQFSLCTTSVGNVFVSHTATVHVSRPSKWPGIMKGKRSVWIWQLVDDEIWGNCSVDYPNQESILIWCVTGGSPRVSYLYLELINGLQYVTFIFTVVTFSSTCLFIWIGNIYSFIKRLLFLWFYELILCTFFSSFGPLYPID